MWWHATDGGGKVNVKVNVDVSVNRVAEIVGWIAIVALCGLATCRSLFVAAILGLCGFTWWSFQGSGRRVQAAVKTIVLPSGATVSVPNH